MPTRKPSPIDAAVEDLAESGVLGRLLVPAILVRRKEAARRVLLKHFGLLIPLQPKEWPKQ